LEQKPVLYVHHHTTAFDSITRIQRPAFRFATIEEAKRQCGIDESDATHDDTLNALIPVAQNYVESRAATTLTPTKYRARFNHWGCSSSNLIPIPNPPLLYDSTDFPIVIGIDGGFFVDPLNIGADTLSMPGTVRVNEWPTGAETDARATMTWWAGYQTLGEIPEEFRHAGLMLVANWFENREAAADISLMPVPYAVDALLASASYAGRY
jgi:uncharacterized phiE125 gp8 family phage protein